MIWSPATRGIAFKDLPGAPAPADNPAARLKQMKGLTDRFKVTITGRKADKSNREELRLLPRPLYRYEPARRRNRFRLDRRSSVRLRQGTDPEAILLLEAVHPNGSPRRQYAFARATSTGLEARLDKTVVWAVDVLAGTTTPRDPQIWLTRPRGTAASGVKPHQGGSEPNRRFSRRRGFRPSRPRSSGNPTDGVQSLEEHSRAGGVARSVNDDYIVEGRVRGGSGIEKADGLCGGSARISGTSIPVWQLALARDLGVTEAQLLLDYPALRAEDLVKSLVVCQVSPRRNPGGDSRS